VSDPKLKEAMKEIRKVMAKHDIAGWITLFSPTNSEFGMEITPTWSCAFWEDKDEGKLRFRAKQAELGKEVAKQKIERTAHMIFSMRDLCARGFQYADNMAKLLGTQLQIEHTPLSGFEPHQERKDLDGFRPIEEN